MPDSYMLDTWVLISNFLDCMLQPVGETLYIGVKIRPAAVELVFTIGILARLVKVQDSLHLLRKLTRDCQLSSMIRFVTNLCKPDCKDGRQLKTYF